MFAITSIISLYLTMVVVKDKMKATLFQVMPFVYSCLLLVLYGLSFFSILSFIDYILIIVLVFDVIVIVKNKNWKAIRESIVEDVLDSRSWIWIISTGVGMYLLRNKAFYFWDDFVFWAVDEKAIYFRDGLGAGDLVCAPGNGTYPPIPQLAEWLVPHYVGHFGAGLVYAGLFLALQIYIAPLLDVIPKNKFVAFVLGIPFLIGFGSFSMNKMANLSPDFMVAVVFGCLLCLPFMEISRNSKILIATVEMSVLSLVKNVSFQWVGVLIVFFVLYYGKRILDKKAGTALLLSSVPFIIWHVFCKQSGRTTAGGYFTASNLINDTISVNDYSSHRISVFWSFVKAAFMGMNQNDGIIIFISISWIFASVILCYFVVKYFKKYDFQKATRMKGFVWFLLISEIIVLLFFVEVLFISEYSQYENPEIMVLIFARYGCPVVIGLLMLSIILWGSKLVQYQQMKIIYLIMAGLVSMSPWLGIYDNFVNYGNTDAGISQDCEEKYWLSDSVYNTVSYMDEDIKKIQSYKEIYNKEIVIGTYENYLFYLPYIMAPIPIRTSTFEMTDESIVNFKQYMIDRGYEYFYYIDYSDRVANDNGNVINSRVLYRLDYKSKKFVAVE